MSEAVRLLLGVKEKTTLCVNPHGRLTEVSGPEVQMSAIDENRLYVHLGEVVALLFPSPGSDSRSLATIHFPDMVDGLHIVSVDSYFRLIPLNHVFECLVK